MNLLKMASSYLNPVQPSYLILFVTSLCNAKCSFCFYGDQVASSQRKENELSTGEYEKISKKCGNVPYLLLSGGEPVLRNDLAEIIGFFIENASTQFITVPSNGLSPKKTEKLFSELTLKYPKCHFRAAFSLDYPDKRHDASRQVPGCVDRILEGTGRINQLKKSRKNLTLDVVSIYLHENAGDHEKLRKWVRDSINPDNHELHILRPEWPEIAVEGLDIGLFLREITKYRHASSSMETRYLSPLFRGLNTLYIQGLYKLTQGEWFTKCTAGRKFTVVTELGEVRLCECRTEILGNLRENQYDLMKILKSSTELLNSMNRSKCICTWECAVSCNIICNPRFLPALLKSSIQQYRAARKKE